MSNAPHQGHQILESSTRPRNPYAVLNIAPFDEPKARVELEKRYVTASGLTDGVKKIREVTIENWSDHPHVGRLELLIKNERRGEELEAPKEQKEEKKKRGSKDKEVKKGKWEKVREKNSVAENLERQLDIWRELILTKKELDLLDEREAARLSKALEEAQPTAPKKAVEEDEPSDQVGFRTGEGVIATMAPCLYDLGEELETLMTELKKQLESGKKKRGQSKLKVQVESIKKTLEEHDAALQNRSRLEDYRNVLQSIIDLERLITDKQDELIKRYRDMADRFHPDKNPGNAAAEQRFKEVSEAYKILTEANPDQRRKIAADLVFGQDTGGWTAEMREVAQPVVDMFGALFALEYRMDAETVPCECCKGQGAIPIQERGDYFPVPRRCLECDGEGSHLKVMHDIRKLIEAAAKAKNPNQ